MASYAQYQPSLLPGWLQGVNGLAYAGVLGALKDIISNNARYAAQVGLPVVAPSDALAAIGYERQLERGTAESDAQYAERLRTAFDAWAMAGTPLELLLQIEILYPGIPVVIVQQAARAFTLNPDTTLPALSRLIITTLGGGGWTFDANGGLDHAHGFWSRFAVLFPGPLPAGWAAAVSPPTGATTPTKSQVNQLIRVINKTRPAKATCVYIEVVTSGVVWDWPPGMTWNQGGLNWNAGTMVRFNGQDEYA